MKNLEEQAEQVLKEIKATEQYVETFCSRNGWGEYPLKKLMADFARQAVHQALDEAAEEVSNQSRHPAFSKSYLVGFQDCKEQAQESILKLKENY